MTTGKNLGYNPDEVSITNQVLQKAIELLNEDAKNCYDGIHEFQNLAYTDIPKQHAVIYDLFEIIPVLLCSIIKNNEGHIDLVYLWQMSRFTPYNQGDNSIRLDTTLVGTTLYAAPSLTILLKVQPKQGEYITNAELLAGGHLVVTSKMGDSSIIFRTYNASNLYADAVVNPYKEIKINTEFSSMLVVDCSNSNWKATLYRPYTMAELDALVQKEHEAKSNDDELGDSTKKHKLVGSEILEGSDNLNASEIFSVIHCHAVKQNIILLDCSTMKMLHFSPSHLKIVDLHTIGKVAAFRKVKDSFIVVNQEKGIYNLDLAEEMSSDAIKLIAYFPVDQPLNEDGYNSWKIMKLTRGNSPQPVNHIIYLRENKFYALPLDGSKTEAYVLAQVKKNIENVSEITWDIYLHSINSEVAGNTKVPVIVYSSGEDLCFVDLANNNERNVKDFLKTKEKYYNYKVMRAKPGSIYLECSIRDELRRTIVEVHPTSKFAQLFSDKSCINSHKLLVADLITGEIVPRKNFQVEGSTKQIKLIKSLRETVYCDEINFVFTGVSVLVNNLKKVPAYTGYKPVQVVETQDDAEESKYSTQETITRKVIETTKDASGMVDKHNQTLAELRKEISSQASEVWEQDQEATKRSQKEYEIRGTYRYTPWRIEDQLGPIKEPKIDKVSKEHMEAYKAVKDDKKKKERQRDKEKTKRKNERESPKKFE